MDIMDRFLPQVSRYDCWHKTRCDATAWHRNLQLGAAGPTFLCDETLLEFDPCKWWGKLMKYQALSQAGESLRWYFRCVMFINWSHSSGIPTLSNQSPSDSSTG